MTIPKSPWEVFICVFMVFIIKLSWMRKKKRVKIAKKFKKKML